MSAAGIAPSMLRDSLVNRWLASLPQGSTTRSNYRRMALTLWRFAADRELTDDYPRRVVRVKPRPKAVVAWSTDEMRRLLKEARAYQHTLKTGCPAALLLEGWSLCGYETGLRFSDLHGLRCDQLRENRLYVVPNKTGVAVGKLLSPRLCAILTELSVRGDGRTFFRCHIGRRWVRVHFGRICRQAGLKGTPKFLRRTGATACEAASPGSATRFLGHLSPHLAMKHYVDATLLPDACPVPPSISRTED
jgi:integrase